LWKNTKLKLSRNNDNNKNDKKCHTSPFCFGTTTCYYFNIIITITITIWIVYLSILGLQYEDLLNSEHPHIKEAIELADPEVQLGRKRRLKRATDLSFKTKVLQDYAPDMVLEPFKFHLRDDINKIQQRNNEKDIMNLHKM